MVKLQDGYKTSMGGRYLPREFLLSSSRTNARTAVRKNIKTCTRVLWTPKRAKSTIRAHT